MKNIHTQVGKVLLTYIDIDKEGKDYFGERRVELPIGHDFLNRFNPSTVIEVGSTMFNQERRLHKVVDLYDTSHPHIINVDGAEFDYTGFNVLSVSTIEHFDDKQIDGVWRTGVEMTDKGFLTVKRIAETADKFLLTFPVGIHSRLDASILNSGIPRRIIFRDVDNNWDGRADISNINFGYDREFPCSAAIYLITNIDDYLIDEKILNEPRVIYSKLVKPMGNS
jgi:hypothetical protein